MKRKLHIPIVICLVLIFILSSASCSDRNSDYRGQEVTVCKNIFMNNIPEFTLVGSESKKNDSGDTEEYYVVQFDEENGKKFYSEISTISDWKKTPVSTSCYNICTYVTVVPECSIKKAIDTLNELNKSENCLYFLKDRSYIYEFENRYNLKNNYNKISSSSESKKAGKLENGVYDNESGEVYYNYTTNFSLAFFDNSDYKLYIYVYDKEYPDN